MNQKVLRIMAWVWGMLRDPHLLQYPRILRVSHRNHERRAFLLQACYGLTDI